MRASGWVVCVACWLWFCTVSGRSVAAPNVVVWGDNSQGQTDVPPTLTNAVAIAAGYNHTLALTADGKVVRWGDRKGTQVFPGTGYVAIAAGPDRAVREDGTVWNLGSIGTPVSYQLQNLSNIVQIASGEISWALDADGTVHWISAGPGSVPMTEPLKRIVQIFGMGMSAFALSVDSELRGWGSFGMNPPTGLHGFSNVVSVAGVVPIDLTVVLAGDGRLQAYPERYQTYLKAPAIALAGHAPDLALGADGKIFTMAWTTGLPSSVHPVLSNVVQIASGNAHNVALIGWGAPRFSRQILERDVTAGMPLNIHAPAFGEMPLQYEWRLNGTRLAGQTNAWLHLPQFAGSDAGLYEVSASNSLGGARQQFLIGSIPLSIHTPPTNKIAVIGAETTLVVHARGLNLRWQWERNGIEIPGATNATLRFAGMKWQDEGRYRVRIWNENGSLVSPEATLSGTGVGYIKAEGEKVLARAGMSNIVQLGYLGALDKDGRIAPLGLGGNIFQGIVSSNIVWIDAGAVIDRTGRLEYPAGVFPADFKSVVKTEGGLALRADGTIAAYRETAASRNMPPLADVIEFAVGGICVAVHGDGTVTAWNTRGDEPAELPSGLSNVVAVASGYDAFGGYSAVLLALANQSVEVHHPIGRRSYGPLPGPVLEMDFWGPVLMQDGTMTNLFGPVLERSFEGITDFYPIDSRSDYMVAIGEGVPHFWPARTNRIGTRGKPFYLLGRAAGEMPIMYQWRHGRQDLAGCTNRFLAVHEAGMRSGIYELVASNAIGAATLAYNVEISQAPGTLAVSRRADGQWVVYRPLAGGRHSLLESADLRSWSPLEGATVQTNGRVEFQLPAAVSAYRFYRALTE